MKPLNSAELLRNRVKTAVVDRGRRRALMRAMGLKSQGTITQWLDGEHNPSIDKLDSIAAFLGMPVGDLFRVQQSTTGAFPVTPSDVHSAHGAAPTRLLEQQLAATERENAALRVAVDELANRYKALATYNRSRYLTQRTALLQRWADYLDDAGKMAAVAGR